MILERADLGNDGQIRGDLLLFLALFGFIIFALIFWIESLGYRFFEYLAVEIINSMIFI